MVLLSAFSFVLSHFPLFRSPHKIFSLQPAYLYLPSTINEQMKELCLLTIKDDVVLWSNKLFSQSVR